MRNNREERSMALCYAFNKIKENNMEENVLKVGDKVRVFKKPKMWSSSLNENSPLDLKFPYELTIKNIEGNNMTCGDYGWNLRYITIAGYELLSEEWHPKQGDKVLVPNCRKGYSEKIYIATYNGLHIVKDIVLNHFTQYAYIKPYEDEIKVGDWVKRISDASIWKIRDKDDVNVALNSECTKITNPQLIKLLNNEL